MHRIAPSHIVTSESYTSEEGCEGKSENNIPGYISMQSRYTVAQNPTFILYDTSVTQCNYTNTDTRVQSFSAITAIIQHANSNSM